MKTDSFISPLLEQAVRKRAAGSCEHLYPPKVKFEDPIRCGAGGILKCLKIGAHFNEEGVKVLCRSCYQREYNARTSFKPRKGGKKNKNQVDMFE